MKYCPVIEDIVLEDDCRGCDECRLQDDPDDPDDDNPKMKKNTGFTKRQVLKKV